MLNVGFNVQLRVEKQECYSNPGDKNVKDRFVVYKLTKQELDGDVRPKMILRNELEDDFFDNIPI